MLFEGIISVEDGRLGQSFYKLGVTFIDSREIHIVADIVGETLVIMKTELGRNNTWIEEIIDIATNWTHHVTILDDELGEIL